MNSSRRTATALAGVVLILTATVALAEAEHSDGRSVGVTGQGEVLAQPDRAFVTLGIEARNLQLDAARAEVNETVERVLELTRELGIEAERVDASRISIRPEYDWNPEQRERRFLGYYVARQIEVDLRNLEQLGRLLERAVDLGVNQLGDPRLDSTRRRELEREALALAVKDARANAQVIAEAAAATLGPVRHVSANAGVIAPPPRFAMMEARMASDSGAAETYVTGDMKFTATVQAEYDLVVPAR